MTFRKETLAEGVDLYLGDCRIAREPRRKPWGKTPIKAVVACRKCDWTWKPTTGFGYERCPKCEVVRSVRDRNYEGKRNIASLKEHLKGKPRRAGDWERTYRRRAVLLVGRGSVTCVRCGCDNTKLLEINHKNGGGGKEFKRLGNKFYRDIAKMVRNVDDLELLCKPCNSVHALELNHGPLPFKVMWGGNAN